MVYIYLISDISYIYFTISALYGVHSTLNLKYVNKLDV